MTDENTATADDDPPLACFAPGCGAVLPWGEWHAHVLGHALPAQEDRDAWLLARRSFVGASEVGAICGVNPFDSALDLWTSKVKGKDRRKPNLEGRSTARLGHLLEPVLLADYARRHGVTVEPSPSLRHPSHPWAGATPDGVASDGKLIQVKLVGAKMLVHWQDGPPHYVTLQVQWELFVSGRAEAVVLAGLGGTDIEEYPVLRDDDLIENTRVLVDTFWHDCVLPRRLPQDFDGAPSDETLRTLYPYARKPLAAPTDEIIALVRRYIDERKVATDAKGRQDAIGALLKARIGEAEGFQWPAGRVTWKNTKGGLDKDALMGALLELVPEAERQTWIDRFTTDAGPRRLDVKLKGE